MDVDNPGGEGHTHGVCVLASVKYPVASAALKDIYAVRV